MKYMEHLSYLSFFRWCFAWSHCVTSLCFAVLGFPQVCHVRLAYWDLPGNLAIVSNPLLLVLCRWRLMVSAFAC
jgi:hypothetical protein